MSHSRPRATLLSNTPSGVRNSVRVDGTQRRSSDSVRAQRANHLRLAEALSATPRERFVPEGVRPPSSDEDAVWLGAGRSIPPVRIVAMMVGALELNGSERVLDIGSSSGYQAALLSRLAREVVSVEVDERCAADSRRVLTSNGITNVRVLSGDPCVGFSEAAPYQAIVVGSALSKLPSALLAQLDVGGRLVIALGDSECQLIERLRKRVDGLDSETIGSCRLEMLDDELPPRSFPWTNPPRSG